MTGSAVYQIGFELLHSWIGNLGTTLTILAIFPGSVLIGGAILVSRLLNRVLSPKILSGDDDAFQPYPVLALLISPVRPGAKKTDEYAINVHIRGQTLRRCYLIHTPGSQARADELYELYNERYSGLSVHLRLAVVGNEIRPVYREMVNVVDHALGHGFAASEIIVDITGGLKPMSAGATLACADRGVAIQYIESVRNDAGDPTGRLLTARRVLLSGDLDAQGSRSDSISA